MFDRPGVWSLLFDRSFIVTRESMLSEDDDDDDDDDENNEIIRYR